MLDGNGSTVEPRHGQIKRFYAVVWDANVREWIMVECSRADLLKQVVNI